MALSVAPTLHWMGNDGPWSTFYVYIGNSPEPFEVLPASSVSLTLVVLQEGCPKQSNVPDDCETLRGNLLDTYDLGSAWQPIFPDIGGEKQYNEVAFPAVGIFLDEPVVGELGLDSLNLSWFGDVPKKAQMPLEDQLIAGYAAKTPQLGLLGISGWQAYPANLSTPYNSVLQTLKNTSAITGITWAYTAGANYKNPQSYGSLTFGGYDSSLVNMDQALANIDFPRGSEGNGKELTLEIKAITIGDTPTKTFDKLTAILDSMLPDIWLPPDVCDLFAQEFDLQWNSTVGMYVVDDEQRQRLLNDNKSISFELGSDSNSQVVTINLPYAAFDRELKWPLANITADDNKTLHYFPVKPTRNGTQGFTALLGRTFFQEAYVSVDYEERTFSVGQTISPPRYSDPVLVELHPKDPPGLSAGAIAGIAVGAFILLSIAAAVTWWMRRRRRRERLARETRTTRTISVDEITLAALDPDSADRSEYYKPPQELIGEAKGPVVTPAFIKHELDANATATGPMGQQLERHELEAGSVHYRPSHRHNLSFGSSVSGISPMGVGERVSDAFGEPSPPLALSSGSPSPPLSDRRLERPGSPFPPFEMP